jgi:hypothetical protein
MPIKKRMKYLKPECAQWTFTTEWFSFHGHYAKSILWQWKNDFTRKTLQGISIRIP